MVSVGIIGDLNTVIGFRGLGLLVRPVENVEEATEALVELAARCAVIYLTEDYATELAAELNAYSRSALPAIILIPSSLGSSGIGMKNMRDAVRRAVGIDLLGDDTEVD